MGTETFEAKCTKCSIYFFNFIFFFVAITLIFLGIWIIFALYFVGIEYNYHMLVVCMVLFVTGGLILIAGVAACCGSLRENKTVLYVFIGVMWVILILEIFLAIWIFYSMDSIKHDVGLALTRELEEYPGNKQIDGVQYNYECCGVDSYADWRNSTWGKRNPGKLPLTCCPTDVSFCYIDDDMYYQNGCVNEVAQYIGFTYSVIMAVLLACAFMQIVGISLAYTLTRTIREYDMVENPDPKP